MTELGEIKKLRQLFYGNRTNLGEVLQFGPEKTALNQETIDFLGSNMPTMSQFHQVETSLLQRGINTHGLKFLYAFMNPTPNPNAVGIFGNRPVPIPYGATGRLDPYATIYENVDGRYIRPRVENIYNTSENINKPQRDRLEKIRREFESQLELAQTLNGENTIGENGEQGVKVMVLSPGLSPIGIETRHLTKVENNKVHSEFRRFVNKYGENANISETIRSRFKEVLESMENKETITSTMEYESAIRQLVFENMLTGKDGNKFYIEFLNGNNTEKVMNRIKLYNTKKFVRANDVFLRDVAESYREIGDTKTDKVIRRIIRNQGFGVSIWNDSQYATVKAEVEKIIRDNKIEGWDFNNVIGNAHTDV